MHGHLSLENILQIRLRRSMSKVLITGGSEGIGFGFAKYYASKGYDVILVARNQMKLLDAKNMIENTYHKKVEIISYDLSVKDAARSLYEKLESKTIDILINNAGCGYTGRSWKIDIEKEEDMVMVNDVALMSLTKLFVNDMKKRHAGIIMNVSSTGSFQPGPYIAGYYASKSFVTSYTQAIHEEMKPYGVQVYCLCPGPVYTSFYDKSGTKNPRWAMDVDKVVDYTIKHMKKKCLIMPGFTNRLVRILPVRVRMSYVRKMKQKSLK